jgi:hypothetical protein
MEQAPSTCSLAREAQAMKSGNGKTPIYYELTVESCRETVRVCFSLNVSGSIYLLLPSFQNIRCFRFMKQMYLDTF